MLGIRQAFVCLTLACANVLAAPQHRDDSIVNWERLTEILDNIDSETLHSTLHSLAPKFRDGIFSHDQAAIQHVHATNPIFASKLVYIAKRQDNSTTTTTPTSSSTTAEPTTSSSVAPVESSVSNAVSSQITASTLPAPTTIEVAPSTAAGETAVSTVSGAVVFSSIGGGVVTKTSSAVGVEFTRSTSTHIFTYTASDGSIQTSTSLIVVNAPVTATAVQTGAAAKSGDTGLQNAASRHTESELSALFSAGIFSVLSFIAAIF